MSCSWISIVLLAFQTAQVFREIINDLKDGIKDEINHGLSVSDDDTPSNLALAELEDRLGAFLTAKMEALEQVRLPCAFLLVLMFSRRV